MEYTALLEKQILGRLKIDNPWWTEGRIPSYYQDMSPRLYLDIFYPLVKDVSIQRALILMGPRRVGKTVMLYHSIQQLIDDGVSPQNIIYVSVETPIYNNILLEQLFSLAKQILSKEDSQEEFYVFFDEIQYLKDWEINLKSLVDTYHNVKFVVSGSAAAALKKSSNESGAGRFTDFNLPPLLFFEYIHLVDKVLLRDLPSLYGISDVQELNSLFTMIAYHSGMEFSYESMSKESGVKKETIRKYIQYLEAAFLIKIVTRTDDTAKRFQRQTTFKIYLTNPSLRCALFEPIKMTDGNIGDMIETAIYSQWIPRKGHIAYANWKMGRSQGEVDLVGINDALQKPYWAVEIKWSDRFFDKPSELSSLQFFMEKNHLPQALVTSISKGGTKNMNFGTLHFIPSACYAYTVGENTLRQAQKSFGL